MVTWRVLVHYKKNFIDHRGEHLKKEWRTAGFAALQKIKTGQAYELTGETSEADLRQLADKLLTDPVTQEASVFPADRMKAVKGARLAEIWPKPGVSDPVADTVQVGARDLMIAGIDKIRTGQVFEFWGKASAKDVKTFCESHLMNPLIQKVEIQ